jgi:perosamine synthetase
MLSTNATTLAIDGGKPVAATPVPMVRVDVAEEDIQAAVAVMRSGMLAQGRNVEAFEKRFAEMTDAPHAAACANGTCALQLAYEPLIQPGDKVLVPAWTYIATASMLVARGAAPVFCDVHADTFCIDVADAERRLAPGVTAVAVTHLYGNAADIDAVEDLAKRKGLRVIYDAAQAHMATWKGKGLGAYGDAVTYSFYPTKNMTTGEGGMVTTRDAELDREVRLLRSHGETRKYYHERIGYNYRMTDLEGAVGLSQCDRIEAITARRRANADVLDAALAEVAGVATPVATRGAEHAYHLYTIRIEPGAFTVDRDRFAEALRAEGVQCAVHYPHALTKQPCFADFVDGAVPVSESLSSQVLCLPIHQGLTDAQVAQVAQGVAKVAEAYRA